MVQAAAAVTAAREMMSAGEEQTAAAIALTRQESALAAREARDDGRTLGRQESAMAILAALTPDKRLVDTSELDEDTILAVKTAAELVEARESAAVIAAKEVWALAERRRRSWRRTLAQPASIVFLLVMSFFAVALVLRPAQVRSLLQFNRGLPSPQPRWQPVHPPPPPSPPPTPPAPPPSDTPPRRSLWRHFEALRVRVQKAIRSSFSPSARQVRRQLRKEIRKKSTLAHRRQRVKYF